MEIQNFDKPRLIECGQGLNILNHPLHTVEYRGKLLYSKYNPLRTITQSIGQLEILKGTLVIVNSPCLCYGLNELIEKLPEDCIVLLLEADSCLRELTGSYMKLYPLGISQNENNYSLENLLPVLDATDFAGLDARLRNIANTGKIRRAMAIDFSAGAQFYKDIYNQIHFAASSIIERFWKNHITLVKFGKLFCKNFFHNCREIAENPLSRTLDQLRKSINKPVLVCGAGESLESIYPYRKQINNAFYVIAADAAIVPLQNAGIKVNAAVALESQNAITKSYIGLQNRDFLFFADTLSRYEIPKMLETPTVWFTSSFADCRFLEQMGNQIPRITPMGSVGLAATFIGLYISNNMPVFTCGLDFSYSAGRTHCKETAAYKKMLYSRTRLNDYANFGASFSAASTSCGTNKTTPALLSYANQFSQMFSGCPNLYTINRLGPDLGCQTVSVKEMIETVSRIKTTETEKPQINTKVNYTGILSWLGNEKKSLEELKDILTNGDKSIYRNKNDFPTLNQQISFLAEPRDYLYLYFPDGFRFRTDSDFLKRIRAQIDFFLKQIGNI